MRVLRVDATIAVKMMTANNYVGTDIAQTRLCAVLGLKSPEEIIRWSDLPVPACQV
jgi:hypothetical protein